MKKHLLFLSTIIALTCPTAFGATIPAIGVQEAHGVAKDHYYVHLSDYNRIDFDDKNDQYTLVAAKEKDSEGNPLSNITLDAKQYPMFMMEDIPEDVVTSIETVSQQDVCSLRFSPTNLSIETSLKEVTDLTVYSISGQIVLGAKLSPGDALSVSSLPHGIYVAAAEGTQTNLSIKFMR